MVDFRMSIVIHIKYYMAKCKIQNCNEKIKCKDLCHKHYNSINYRKHIEKRREYDKSFPRRFKKLEALCKREKIPLDITYQGWLSLIKSNVCHYCPNSLPTHGYSLDRKVFDLGYTLDNVVPCCETCNIAKRDTFTYEEFKVMMKALKDYRERKRL